MSESRKFYWIRLKTDFFNLAEIDYLQRQKNGSDYIVLYLILCLITANNGGELSSRIGEMIIPFDVNKIARDTKFSVDTVVVALELFKKLGLIYEQTDGVLMIPYVKEVVGSETEYAEKKRQARKRKKGTMSPTLSETKSDKRLETRDKRLETRDKSSDDEISDKKTLCQKAENIVAIFNSVCSELNNVVRLSDKRKEKIDTLTKAYSDEEIRAAFEKANSSDFLTGKVKNFKAGFDWLIEPENFIKVLEGNYDNRESDNSKPSYSLSEIERQSLDLYKDIVTRT